jgi:hypothetical protein
MSFVVSTYADDAAEMPQPNSHTKVGSADGGFYWDPDYEFVIAPAPHRHVNNG